MGVSHVTLSLVCLQFLVKCPDTGGDTRGKELMEEIDTEVKQREETQAYIRQRVGPHPLLQSQSPPPSPEGETESQFVEDR